MIVFRFRFVKRNDLAVVTPNFGIFERGVNRKFVERTVRDVNFKSDVRRWIIFRVERL
jgi:hypothetical protein